MHRELVEPVVVEQRDVAGIASLAAVEEEARVAVVEIGSHPVRVRVARQHVEGEPPAAEPLRSARSSRARTRRHSSSVDVELDVEDAARDGVVGGPELVLTSLTNERRAACVLVVARARASAGERRSRGSPTSSPRRSQERNQRAVAAAEVVERERRLVLARRGGAASKRSSCDSSEFQSTPAGRRRRARRSARCSSARPRSGCRSDRCVPRREALHVPGRLASDVEEEVEDRDGVLERRVRAAGTRDSRRSRCTRPRSPASANSRSSRYSRALGPETYVRGARRAAEVDEALRLRALGLVVGRPRERRLDPEQSRRSPRGTCG